MSAGLNGAIAQRGPTETGTSQAANGNRCEIPPHTSWDGSHQKEAEAGPSDTTSGHVSRRSAVENSMSLPQSDKELPQDPTHS